MNANLIRQRILIRLQWDGRRVTRVEITSDRAVHLPNCFTGRKEKDVRPLLPRLFTLCGQAHSIAARHAFAQALGRNRPVTIAEKTILLLENVRESLFQILLSWGNPETNQVIPLTRSATVLLKQATDKPFSSPAKDLKKIDDDLKRLREGVEKTILGEETTTFLARKDDALIAWMTRGATPTARFLGTTLTCRLSEVSIPSSLSGKDLPWIAESLESRAWRSYVRHPHVAGAPRHTGPAGQPSVTRLPMPTGLFIRRLSALASALRQLTDPDDDGLEGASPIRTGHAMACVETARGLLIHKVLLESGTVRAYRILAPTEWNFHPRGIAYHLLKAIEGRQGSEISRVAGWVVQALDPCVDHTIELEAEHA